MTLSHPKNEQFIALLVDSGFISIRDPYHGGSSGISSRNKSAVLVVTETTKTAGKASRLHRSHNLLDSATSRGQREETVIH